MRPDLRIPSEWKNVVHIEAAPPDKLTVVTVFITEGDGALTHESEPSFRLASLPIGDDRYVQLVAHNEPPGNVLQEIARAVADIRRQGETKNIVIPDDAYTYLAGKWTDGSRFILGTRA